MDHSALLEKYTSLKQKENMMLEAKEGKTSKKDILLKHKANNTITKLGNIELDLIEKEDVIESNYNRNILCMTTTKDSKLKALEDKYDADMLKLKNKYETERDAISEKYKSSTNYYETERDSSLRKTKNEFESKKRTLESRGECIEQERNLSVKSASEITLEKQKYDILRQIQNNITTIQMSRDQLPKDTPFNTCVPTLPEPLANSTAPPPPTASTPPTQKSNSSEMPAWLVNLGEDSSLTLLREESRREDARIRREAAEEEMIRKEKALAYRRQLESEAADRRKEREAREKEVLKEVVEDEWADVAKEADSYIAAKRPVKCVKKV
jgi:hypothetical protein